jgi:hypothetical protein
MARWLARRAWAGRWTWWRSDEPHGNDGRSVSASAAFRSVGSGTRRRPGRRGADARHPVHPSATKPRGGRRTHDKNFPVHLLSEASRDNPYSDVSLYIFLGHPFFVRHWPDERCFRGDHGDPPWGDPPVGSFRALRPIVSPEGHVFQPPCQPRPDEHATA